MFSTPNKKGATLKKPPTPRKPRRKPEKNIERKTKKSSSFQNLGIRFPFVFMLFVEIN
jgi:hypothetical protein